jgi:activating signal cointegrator 1
VKAITICQPYPFLICLPETDPRHKRVENRDWPTKYRGPLLIHAGRSREWLQISDDGKRDEMYEIELAALVFGAFVATAELVDCFHIRTIRAGYHDAKYPWLREHIHANGEYCWVLQDIRPLPKPVPWRGALGLWEVSYDEVRGRAVA